MLVEIVATLQRYARCERGLVAPMLLINTRNARFYIKFSRFELDLIRNVDNTRAFTAIHLLSTWRIDAIAFRYVESSRPGSIAAARIEAADEWRRRATYSSAERSM